MIDIFRKKDVTAVDRDFGESFIQHDPNLADGLVGMKSRAEEIASSPAADITIFRTLVDGDLVVLHSRYEGLDNVAGPLLAFDLFRFKDDKIVEHWGGQQAESSARNLSGHTQVGWSHSRGGPRRDRRQPNLVADLQGRHNRPATLRSDRRISR
jgi:predicted SnoaL-like aldol condensation-catalyzing enzyme